MNEFEQTYEDYQPGTISWVTALFCTFTVFTCLSYINSFFADIQTVAIKERIINLIEVSVRPDAILNDEFIKKEPQKKLVKIQKNIDLYNFIYSDSFERAKIIADEPTQEESVKIQELRKLLTLLYEVKKDLKLPPEAMKVSPQETIKAYKDKALVISKEMIQNESIPKVKTLSEAIYKEIKSII